MENHVEINSESGESEENEAKAVHTNYLHIRPCPYQPVDTPRSFLVYSFGSGEGGV